MLPVGPVKILAFFGTFRGDSLGDGIFRNWFGNINLFVLGLGNMGVGVGDRWGLGRFSGRRGGSVGLGKFWAGHTRLILAEKGT